jgi:hypothetical protein
MLGIQSADSKRKPFHPLANIFPLMTGKDFDELVKSIKLNGLRESIVIFEDKILDGRNRARACEAAGVEPRFTPFRGEDPTSFVIDMNVRRRHLTQEQKRECIDKLLQANPERSDRQIAEVIKADHKTIATVRKEKERRGERKQPVTKVWAGADYNKNRLGNNAVPPKVDKHAVSAKVDKHNVNALIGVWDMASDKERREFVLERKIEIMKVQQLAEGLVFDPSDNDPDSPENLDHSTREPVTSNGSQPIIEPN